MVSIWIRHSTATQGDACSLTHPFSPYVTPHLSYISPALFDSKAQRTGGRIGEGREDGSSQCCGSTGGARDASRSRHGGGRAPGGGRAWRLAGALLTVGVSAADARARGLSAQATPSHTMCPTLTCLCRPPPPPLPKTDLAQPRRCTLINTPAPFPTTLRTTPPLTQPPSRLPNTPTPQTHPSNAPLTRTPHTHPLEPTPLDTAQTHPLEHFSAGTWPTMRSPSLPAP